MKTIPLVFALILAISPHSDGQEKLVPMRPQGDPALVDKAKSMLEFEFGEESKINILSVKPFDDPAWMALFPDSSPSIVQAVVTHPESGHAASISFVVSSAGDKYVVDYRSMEPTSLLKVLRNKGMRIEKAKDAEVVARAYVALCDLTVADEVNTTHTNDGYTVRIPIKAERSGESKQSDIELRLVIDEKTQLISKVSAETKKLLESKDKE
jgi:hypothetical protein